MIKEREKSDAHSGFIAIISVIILSAVISFLIASLFRFNSSELSISSFQERSQEASFLARACLREGIFKLKENIDYQGDENLKLNGEECLKIKVEDLASSEKEVSSLVAVGSPPHFQRSEREIRYYIASKAEDWEDYQELENLDIVGDNLELAKSNSVERTTSVSSDWNNYFDDSLNNLEVVDDSLELLKTDDTYSNSGSRVSPPLSLDEIKEVEGSSISWDSSQPEGTDITIKTAVNSDPNTEPADYSVATNGGQIPSINLGEDLTGKYLWVRQELETSDISVTPVLNSLIESISEKANGDWISNPIDFSSQSGQEKKIFKSQIFWSDNSYFENFVAIEVRTSPDGENWSEWQEVRNGGEVPGLERGDVLGSVYLQIKAIFSGGPDIYPLLENIKVFVELE